MDEKSQKIFEEKLVKEKARLEKGLKKNKVVNDYGSSEDANVYEFEEREERIGFGKNLSTLLDEVNYSLDLIKKGKYGICQSCGEKIEIGRLKIFPTAVSCSTCANKKRK